MDGQQAQQLAWGIGFAGMMYIIGNGVWINHMARQKIWKGWLMWVIASLVVIVGGAFIETRFAGATTSMWQQITGVDKENHWIALTLFALMSTPGGASVIFRLSAVWTRIALIIPAVVVFIPAGMQLGNGNNIVAGFGLTLAICALLTVWQKVMDIEPLKKQKQAA
ncbi:MAG: hypothetical protein R8K53_08135 [Mariprofundaceae bacterium]